MVKNNVIEHGLEILDELDNTDAQMANGSVHVQGSNNLIENNINTKLKFNITQLILTIYIN